MIVSGLLKWKIASLASLIFRAAPWPRFWQGTLSSTYTFLWLPKRELSRCRIRVQWRSQSTRAGQAVESSAKYPQPQQGARVCGLNEIRQSPHGMYKARIQKWSCQFTAQQPADCLFNSNWAVVSPVFCMNIEAVCHISSPEMWCKSELKCLW